MYLILSIAEPVIRSFSRASTYSKVTFFRITISFALYVVSIYYTNLSSCPTIETCCTSSEEPPEVPVSKSFLSAFISFLWRMQIAQLFVFHLVFISRNIKVEPEKSHAIGSIKTIDGVYDRLVICHTEVVAFFGTKLHQITIPRSAIPCSAYLQPDEIQSLLALDIGIDILWKLLIWVLIGGLGYFWVVRTWHFCIDLGRAWERAMHDVLLSMAGVPIEVLTDTPPDQGIRKERRVSRNGIVAANASYAWLGFRG